jgi:ADP-L-glycero-D-manno-heptose 6-epimerase
MIIVTGAAGFIGSCLVSHLNSLGYTDLILVDAFGREDKERNLLGKSFSARVERDHLFEWLEKEKPAVSFCFHYGARTDTTEFDYAVHERLNLEYSKKIWEYCTASQIPLVYASSAATYGDGQLGYADDHALIPNLKPLNPYGISKNEFDKWVLLQKQHPPFWAGLKFFNVYGPNEYHKGRMASVIFHGYHQLIEKGEIRLFRSHRPDFKDGEQLRDFIYVKDILKVSAWLMQNKQTVPSAIYNLGTGKARSFKDLATATFTSLGKAPNILFIDMPEDLREKYQYFTEARMEKLIAAGYREPFYSLEEGVRDYVTRYLAPGLFF